MSVEAIRSITAPFRSHAQPEVPGDLASYQLEYPFPSPEPDDDFDPTADIPDGSITDSVWLTPPHTMLFYVKGSATPPPLDTIKQHVLDSLHSNDAVFILSVRKDVGIPMSWIAALEKLKTTFSPAIDFDFMFIPSGTSETFGCLYVDEHYRSIPLDHDNYVCTTDDALMAELEMCITEMTSPLYKRCHAVRKEVEKVTTASHPIEDLITPDPVQRPIVGVASFKKPARSVDIVDQVFARWEAESRADRDAANKARLAAVRSSSRP